MSTYIFVSCMLPTWVFIVGGTFRFLGGKELADNEPLCNFGIWLMLGSITFSLMAHSPNITISFGG